VYLPRHFTVTDLGAVAAFVDTAGAADLVTFDGSKPVATLLPVFWDRPPGFPDPDAGHGVLVGHLALANPQWQTAQPDALALAIVRGPTSRRPGMRARPGTAGWCPPGTTRPSISPAA
jgi:transcriptional regulator